MKKEKIEVYISECKGSCYPFEARYTLNGNEHLYVFETERQLKNYMDCMFITRKPEYIKR